MFELQQYEVSPSPRSMQCCPICHPQGKSVGGATAHREHCVAQTAKECVDLVHPLHSLTDTAALLRRIEEIELRLTTTRNEAHTSPPPIRGTSPSHHVSLQRELFVRVENHVSVCETEGEGPDLHQKSSRAPPVTVRSPSPMDIQRISTSRGTTSPPPCELVDESTGTETRPSVDRGCGDSLAQSLISHIPPPPMSSPAEATPSLSPPRGPNAIPTTSIESVVLGSILRERFSGYHEASSNLYDATTLRKYDLLSTASNAIFVQTQAEFVALRRGAERAQRDVRLSQCLATVSRMEELTSDHNAAIARWFEESVTRATMEWTRSAQRRLSIERAQTSAERTIVHEVVPKSSSNSSIVELNQHHHRQLSEDPVDSDNGEPIEPRNAVPRQPTPVGIRKRSASIQTPPIRAPVVVKRVSTALTKHHHHEATQYSAIKRRTSNGSILQPPWNGSTSLLGDALPQARSSSAPRKRSSYAENFALSTASRARLGVEEPTSSFLESATPRYQVRFAGTAHHHRHARCHDHWCEDLDLH